MSWRDELPLFILAAIVLVSLVLGAYWFWWAWSIAA